MFLADDRAITAFFRVEFRGDGVPVNRGNPRRKGTGVLDIPCQIALSCFFLLCQFQAFVKRRP